MKYWKVDCDYQSIAAMGNWHGQTKYVEAHTAEEAQNKVFELIRYGYNFGANTLEVSKEDWDCAPEYMRVA